MNELAQKHCSTITGDTPKLNDQDTRNYLAKLPDWRVYEKNSEPRLEKAFQFKDFKQAADFTNRVAYLADEEDHHPSILTEWGKVTVTWWTHKISGLHLNDFIMAAKTEQLYRKLF